MIRNEDVSVVNRFIYIMNSFLTLRNFLPLLVDDPNVKINLLKDTVINQQNCFGLQIIDKGRMLGLGVEVHKADDPNFQREYFLAVKKDDYQPILFSQIYSLGKYFKTSYSDVKVSPQKGPVWKGIYPDGYQFLTIEDFMKRIKNQHISSVGKLAPNWQLPSTTKGLYELSKNKGKLILLEFWFVGCPPCVRAEPYLNRLTNQYDSSEFEIVSIEFQNELGKIEEYLKSKKLKNNYKILYGGKEVANEYGVQVGPTFILLNDEGKILFSKFGFTEAIAEEIEALINENI